MPDAARRLAVRASSRRTICGASRSRRWSSSRASSRARGVVDRSAVELRGRARASCSTRSGSRALFRRDHRLGTRRDREAGSAASSHHTLERARGARRRACRPHRRLVDAPTSRARSRAGWHAIWYRVARAARRRAIRASPIAHDADETRAALSDVRDLSVTRAAIARHAATGADDDERERDDAHERANRQQLRRGELLARSPARSRAARRTRSRGRRRRSPTTTSAIARRFARTTRRCRERRWRRLAELLARRRSARAARAAARPGTTSASQPSAIAAIAIEPRHEAARERAARGERAPLRQRPPARRTHRRRDAGDEPQLRGSRRSPASSQREPQLRARAVDVGGGAGAQREPQRSARARSTDEQRQRHAVAQPRSQRQRHACILALPALELTAHAAEIDRERARARAGRAARRPASSCATPA